ncbi:MAG: methylmalonyl-CoA mutase family protein [Kofleriaceae bacterium]
MAGSYFLETLTDQVEAAAWEYIKKIDAMGGIVKAVEEGYPQREIRAGRLRVPARGVDSGRRGIVGLNKYVRPEEGDGIPTLKIAHEIEASQKARIQAFRAQRDRAAVDAALATVRAAHNRRRHQRDAADLAAVKIGVTVGEICALMRTELGEYRDPAYL